MTTLAGEIIMTRRPIGRLASQTPFMADAAHRDRTHSAVAPLPERLTGEMRAELMNLERLVCELLLKNQQLRMALLEATRESVNIVAPME
jgi:hypothetical protein